jgi:hypothetical protein
MTSGTGTSYHSGAHEFISTVLVVFVFLLRFLRSALYIIVCLSLHNKPCRKLNCFLCISASIGRPRFSRWTAQRAVLCDSDWNLRRLITLDRQTAFDVVSHKTLLDKPYESGIQPRLWTIVKDLYTGMYSKIKRMGEIRQKHWGQIDPCSSYPILTHQYFMYFSFNWKASI